MDQLLRLDDQIYRAIFDATAASAVLTYLAIALYWVNWNGLLWWVAGVLVGRARGFGRRGLWAMLTIYLGMVVGWMVTELVLKPLVHRARPFAGEIADLPPTLIDHPATFAFPSGDATFATGAAVALGAVAPRWRVPAYLMAFAVCVERVAVGVHHPADVIAGAIVGIASGLLAPRIVTLLRRRARWRVFVVPHTHWDREWYERFEGYRARLVPMVSKLLDLLERDPSFRSFTFDGQTIALEDALEKLPPKDRDRAAALVKAERLFVGPWYVLADNLLVSGESLVRNFQEGSRVAQSFGRALRVGYVADPFGHPAQVPQILRGFGYATYVFSRGVGDEGEGLGAEFMWESPSGDRVLASHLVDHYAGGLALVGELSETKEELRARVKKRLARMVDIPARYANSSTLLFMEGDDHVEAYERLPEAVAAMHEVAPNLDARITSLEEYEAVVPPPPTLYAGEIISGRYRPILRGVNSTRVWIKQENVACERLLLQRCEPLDAITGGGARDEIRSLWRVLLQNHPHDSICGCSIDAVHDVDMAPRFAQVREDGGALAQRLEQQILGAGSAAVVWNDLPWARDAVVLLDGKPTRVRCAALGAVAATRADGPAVSSPADGVIENEWLRVEVASNGTFVVVDKATGSRSGTQNLLVDDGDRGDLYTYSYAGPTVDSRGASGMRTTAAEGDYASVTVKFDLMLPSSLRPDRLARSGDTVASEVRMSISLSAGARRVDVATIVGNRAKDHRLRVFCETGTRGLTHIAGAAFGWLDRETRISGGSSWIEKPTAEKCVHDLVAIDGALAVGVDGLREYAVLHDGRTIAITLLRAISWLSRNDMPERHGHAGPALETPSAQCIGERTYRYCIVPFSKDMTLAQAAREIHEFLSPARVLRGSGPVGPFVEIPRGSVVQASAIRAGRDGSVVVRLFNPRGSETATTVRFARPVLEARAVDLREGVPDLGNTGLDVIRTAAPPDIRDGALAVKLAGYEIGTYEVRLVP